MQQNTQHSYHIHFLPCNTLASATEGTEINVRVVFFATCLTNLDIVGMSGAVPHNTRYNVSLVSARDMQAI